MHASPSWGTTTSTGSHHHHNAGPPPPGQYRGHHPHNGPPPNNSSGSSNTNGNNTGNSNSGGGGGGGGGGSAPASSGFHPPRSSNSPHHPYRMYSDDTNVFPPPPRMVSGMPPTSRSDFQPPPDFAAPHNPHLQRRPPQAVYIMSSSPADGNHTAPRTGGGIYSWTREDDNRLTEVMKKYKNPRDWEPIAKEHGRGKNAKECHERWIRYLKPGVRKGQWTDQEDAIVVEAVSTSQEQPFTRWSDLAQRLPGRVGKQIRDRWVNHLNPNINHLPFSRDDDLLLWEGHKKLGKRWVEISTKFFNSTRSENHIKNRWYSAAFKKFVNAEYGKDAYTGGSTTTSPFTRDEDVTLWEAHKEMGNRWVEISDNYYNSQRSSAELKNRWGSTSFKKFVASKYGPDAYTKFKNGAGRGRKIKSDV